MGQSEENFLPLGGVVESSIGVFECIEHYSTHAAAMATVTLHGFPDPDIVFQDYLVAAEPNSEPYMLPIPPET